SRTQAKIWPVQSQADRPEAVVEPVWALSGGRLHPQDGARGFSFQLDEGSPKPPELGRLDLDWSDLASPASGPSADGTPLMPHAAAGRRPEPRSLLAAFAPGAAPNEPSASAPAVAPQA